MKKAAVFCILIRERKGVMPDPGAENNMYDRRVDKKNIRRTEQIPNLRTLYLSERIREILRHIRSYAMTAVVAPMGYGKTTALNWYLEGQEREHGAVVLRLSVYSDNLQMFRKQFLNAFASTELWVDLQNVDLSENGAELPLMMDLLEEYLQAHPEDHYLFIDDYHLLSSQKVTDYLVEWAKRQPKNFHLIISSRNVFLSRRAVVELGSRLYPISQEDLRLNYTEIASYGRRCGLSLSEDMTEQLLDTTEGWFSGLYLSLRSYLETGVLPDQTGSIYEMMDEVLLSPLPEEEQMFLLSLCLADDFTQEMAAVLSGREDTAALLESMVSKNAFIMILPDHKTYRFHHILKECTQRRLKALPAAGQNAIRRRYGVWYEEHGLFAKAMQAYRLCEDWDGLLRVIGKDQAMELSYFSKETVSGWVSECPETALKQAPLGLLVLIRRYFSWRLMPEMQHLHQVFLEAVEENKELSETERNDLLGECELVMSFTVYNDIEKMSEYHQRANRLMSRPARSIGNRGTWTFGSPSVLAMFHREPGRLDAEIAAMHRSMPYYYRLTEDHGMGAEYMMEAEALFLRGDLKRARIAMEEGRYKAESVAGRQKEMRFILLCGLFLKLQLSLLGEEELSDDWYVEETIRLRRFRSPLLLTTLDLCAAWYYAELGMTDRIPEWIRADRLDQTNLLFPAKPVAEIICNCVRLARQDHAGVLAREKEITGLCQVYPYTLCRLYLELQLAQACLGMGQKGSAAEHTRKAVQIAEPDGLILPFAWHPELAEFLPQTMRGQAFGWTARMQSCREEAFCRLTIPSVLRGLTGQEQKVALLMAEGKRNREIAAELFLGEGTVKQYINHIYSKLKMTGTATEKRTQLIRLLNTNF